LRCSRPQPARRAALAATACVALACARQSTPSAPAPSSVDPRTAYTTADVPITIRGAHFEPVATQRIGNGGGLDVDATFLAFLGGVALRDVRWQAPDRLTAIVPQGLNGGPYDLLVVGPTGEGILRAAFAGSTARPAAMTALVSAPPRIEQGTQAEVDLIFQDVGDAVVKSPQVQLNGDANVAVVSVPAVGGDIASQAIVHLVGLVAGQSPGPGQLSLLATGTDAFDGHFVTATSSAQVQIVAPPSLSVATVPIPDLVSVGQSLDLLATVTNQGDVDALAVTVSPLTISGAGGAVVDSVPGPQDVPAGATRTFHVAAHATSPGAVFFAGTLSGTDALTGAPVAAQAQWPIVFVQAAAQLSARWLTVPAMVTPGQTFTATLGVTNTGEALATGVSAIPDPPTVASSSGSGSLTASAAQSVLDVPGGSTVVFAWTFTAAGTPPDSLQLSAGASGSDANSGVAIAASAVTSPAIALQAPSALSATLAAPTAVLRVDQFTVTLTVTDTGGIGVNGLTASISSMGTTTVQCPGGATPSSQNVAGGASVSFTWSCRGTADGAAALTATVSGTDALDGVTVRRASAGATVTVADAVQLASSPLGAATTFAYVFDFNGRVYAGPGSDGTGAMRMMPDGSSPEPVTFSFQGDTVNGNDNSATNGPFPSLGYAGCNKDTLQCGPDNENGRGLFTSGVIAGTPWLLASGAKTSNELWHVYGTPDTGTAPVFRYDYVRNVLKSVLGTSSMLVFHDRVYIGFPDTDSTRPTYIVLRTMPSTPGSTPVIGTDVMNLRIDLVSGIGSNGLINRNMASPAMIDSQVAFNDLIYVANNGGIAHSNSNDPQPPASGFPPDWTAATPSDVAYGAKSSVTTKKTHDLEPADKAIPQMAALGGNLYAARNTTSGPQLWVCTPGTDLSCSPNDWTLLAANGIGDMQLSQFDDPQNTRIALLVATSSRLYVGYNNTAGLVIYRSTGTNPLARSDFEGAGGCDASLAPSSCDGLGGRGLGVSATRIFDGRVLTFGGKDYVYLTAGTGTSGFRVFRLVR
jgi:hypothetical protein